jgi:hypothetical protein
MVFMKKNNYDYKEAVNGLEAVQAFVATPRPFNVVLMGPYLSQRSSIAQPRFMRSLQLTQRSLRSVHARNGRQHSDPRDPPLRKATAS